MSSKKLTVKKLYNSITSSPDVVKVEKQFEKDTGFKVYTCKKCLWAMIYKDAKMLREFKESHKKQCKEKQKEAEKMAEELMNKGHKL